MNDKDNMASEAISALADGRLSGAELAGTLELLDNSEQALATWHAYQVVGDVLRSAELAPTADDMAFWTKLEAQLPKGVERLSDDTTAGVELPALMPIEQRGASANNIRWKWFASAAMSALVVVVGAQVWTQVAPQSDGKTEQLVAVPAPVSQSVAQESEGVMIRDPALDALMAAHQQLGGHSALQGPNGFLRNATYERPQR